MPASKGCSKGVASFKPSDWLLVSFVASDWLVSGLVLSGWITVTPVCSEAPEAKNKEPLSTP